MDKNTTNKTNWQKAVEMLLSANVAQELIDAKIKDLKGNKERFDALLPLLSENGLEFKKRRSISVDNTPTLRQYFGNQIAELLIQRKELSNSIKKIDIKDFENKPFSQLTKEELKIAAAYSNSQDNSEKLKSIDEKLEKLGVKLFL